MLRKHVGPGHHPMPAVLGLLSIFSALPFPSLFLFPFLLFLLRAGFKTCLMDVVLELSLGQQDLALQILTILILYIAAAWKASVHFFEEEVAIRMRPPEVATCMFSNTRPFVHARTQASFAYLLQA